jgi:hypothetical protein
MKAVLAVVTSLVVLVLGWLFIGGLFYVMGLVAIEARPQGSLFFIVHVFLMWVLSPGVAGYFAVFVTSRLFRFVPVPTLYVSFISVVGVLTMLLFLFGIAGYSSGRSSLGQLVLFVLQAVAIFVGARIARGFAEAKRVSYE